MPQITRYITLLMLIFMLFFNTRQQVLAAPNIEVIDAAVVGSGDMSLVLDSSGFPVIAYNDGLQLILMHCNDLFCAGNDESVEVLNVNQAQSLSMQLDAAGFPVIAVFTDLTDDLLLVHCNDVNCAGNDESIETVDSAGSVGRDVSMQLDANGFPVMSYLATGIDLKVAHCNDVNCAGGDESLELVDIADEVGTNNSIQLDSAGNPIIVYYDDTNDQFKLAHCNDVNCAGNDETIVVLGPSAGGGIQTGFVLDGSGFPVIAHLSNTGFAVQLIHCNDADCVGGDESSIALSAGTNFPSLVLDSSGNPVIISKNSSDTFNIILCNDANCVGNNETVIPIPTTGLSWRNDLVLDANDYPVVVFNDIVTRELILARCYNPLCGEVRYTSNPPPSGTINIRGADAAVRTANLFIGNTGDINTELGVTQVGTLTNYTLSALPVDLRPGAGFVVTITCTIPQASETLTLQSNEPGTPTYTYTLTCEEGIPPGAPPDTSDEGSGTSPVAPDPTETPAPEITIYDPAISKIGFLVPGQTGVQGEVLEWVVTVSNTGNAPGQNVVITDTLIDALQIDRVEAPGGTVSIMGQTVTVTYDQLPVGESRQFSIFTTVLDGVTVDNTACTSADNQETPECATGSAVSQLPTTGEFSWRRSGLFAILLLSLLGLGGLAVRRLMPGR